MNKGYRNVSQGVPRGGSNRRKKRGTLEERTLDSSADTALRASIMALVSSLRWQVRLEDESWKLVGRSATDNRNR